MKKNTSLLSRAQLVKDAVTDADAFEALRYIRHRETVPALGETAERGKTQLPGVEPALFDLYHSLWSPDPAVKEDVKPAQQYWKTMLEQTLQSGAFQQLHGQTQLSELKSVLGTVAMGETVFALVPEEDKKKLQEMQQAQAQADAAGQTAAQANAQASAAQMLADAAAAQAADMQGQQADGQSSSQAQGGSSGMSAQAAKQLANQLAKQAAQAQANAASKNQAAQEAQAQVQNLAQDLMGGADQKAAEAKVRELTRAGLAAAKNAQAKVQEVSDTLQAWGLEEGELSHQSVPETLATLERMKKSTSLKKFSELLGRIRKIAAQKARTKTSGDGPRVAVLETGRDIRRATMAEKVALAGHPTQRVKALTRWSHGELQLTGQKTKSKLGHGPVVVCEDASGSMDGTKQQWAKAINLALAHFAKLQKRAFGWILFDTVVHRAQTYPKGQMTPNQMLEIVEARAGGGTSFERPLKKALEMIKTAGLKKADIVFVTDGECAVSDGFLQEFKAAKKTLEFSVFTILCDAGDSAHSSVKEFSDRIETASKFTADEAEAKLFRHL